MGCFTVVGATAGCSSDEGNGNGGSDGSSGNGGSDGSGGNGTGGNGGGGSAQWEPFDFDQAGTYEWEITQDDGRFDSLTMEVESVSANSATVTASVNLGGVNQETTVSGTPSEIRDQLSQSVAGAILSTTYLAPPLAQSQGRSFTSNDEWTFENPGGDSATMRVTGSDSFAGLSCRAWEYMVNQETRMEGCVNLNEGVALYFETYEEDGSSNFRMELVEFTPG